MALATRLDRCVAGNDRALAVVRVLTEAEEQKRAHKRQREQLREQRLSLAAQGRSLTLLHGRRETNHWRKADRWKRLEPELAAWLVELLKVFRELILAVDQAVRQLRLLIRVWIRYRSIRGLVENGEKRAAVVHKESSLMAQETRAQAMAERRSFVFDGSTTSVETELPHIRAARAAGYRLIMVGVTKATPAPESGIQ